MMKLLMLALYISHVIFQQSLAYSLIPSRLFLSSSTSISCCYRGGQQAIRQRRNCSACCGTVRILASCTDVASSCNFLPSLKRHGKGCGSHHPQADGFGQKYPTTLYANKPERLKENEAGVLYVNERVSEMLHILVPCTVNSLARWISIIVILCSQTLSFLLYLCSVLIVQPVVILHHIHLSELRHPLTTLSTISQASWTILPRQNNNKNLMM